MLSKEDLKLFTSTTITTKDIEEARLYLESSLSLEATPPDQRPSSAGSHAKPRPSRTVENKKIRRLQGRAEGEPRKKKKKTSENSGTSEGLVPTLPKKRKPKEKEDSGEWAIKTYRRKRAPAQPYSYEGGVEVAKTARATIESLPPAQQRAKRMERKASKSSKSRSKKSSAGPKV